VDRGGAGGGGWGGGGGGGGGEGGGEEGLADLVVSVAVGGLAAVVPVAIGDQGASHGEDDA